METAEKLPKHLNTAVNAIQKQIDKYNREIEALAIRATALTERMNQRHEVIEVLQEQIAKLKGE